VVTLRDPKEELVNQRTLFRSYLEKQMIVARIGRYLLLIFKNDKLILEQNAFFVSLKVLCIKFTSGPRKMDRQG